MSGLKFYYWLVFLSSLGSLAGCQTLEAAFSSPKVTPMQNLFSNIEENSLIYLKGKVTNRAPFLKNGTYQLTDETGHVWILTSDLPKIGESILLKGKLLSEVISLAGKKEKQLYVVEIEKLSQSTTN